MVATLNVWNPPRLLKTAVRILVYHDLDPNNKAELFNRSDSAAIQAGLATLKFSTLDKYYPTVERLFQDEVLSQCRFPHHKSLAESLGGILALYHLCSRLVVKVPSQGSMNDISSVRLSKLSEWFAVEPSRSRSPSTSSGSMHLDKCFVGYFSNGFDYDISMFKKDVENWLKSGGVKEQPLKFLIDHLREGPLVFAQKTIELYDSRSTPKSCFHFVWQQLIKKYT